MPKQPDAADGGERPTRRPLSLGEGQFVPYPCPTAAAASRVGKANPRSGTKPEVALRSALHRRGLRFRKDHAIRGGDGRLIRPDVVFTRARVAIFVDGCFWHGCPLHGTTPKSNVDYWVPKLARNAARDRDNNRRLADEGWEVLRFWEHTPIDEAINTVTRVLAAAQRRR